MTAAFAHIVEEFSSLGGDYRGEVMAAELIRNGLAHDSLYFRSLSIFHRPTSRDIEGLKADANEEGGQQLVMELNREGLYDMLPEGIFHFRKSRRANAAKENILDDIRISRLEEAAARKFFGPFENEFFHRRLQLEIKERALLNAGEMPNKRQLFENLFGSPDRLTDHQVVCLLYLLPIMHKIRGDLERIQYALRLLTGAQVKVTLDCSVREDVYVEAVPLLGESLLGINAIAGDRFQSSDPHYRIEVSGLAAGELTAYFTEGGSRYILEYILPFLLPIQASYEIRLQVAETARSSSLSDAEQPAYLDHNFFI
jgi:type VI secretion system protein ImpH